MRVSLTLLLAAGIVHVPSSAYSSPIINFIDLDGGDARIESIEDLLVTSQLYDVTFYYNMSYNTFAASAANVITFTDSVSAQVAAQEITDIINATGGDISFATLVTDDLLVPYNNDVDVWDSGADDFNPWTHSIFNVPDINRETNLEPANYAWAEFAAVPEPGSLSILALCTGLAACMRRRHRKTLSNANR